MHRPTTAAHVETMLRRHVYPTLGDRPLLSILPSEIQALVKRLSTTLAPATVGVVHRIVAGIFKAAVRDRRLSASPCEGTKLPKAHRERLRPLSLEAVQALVDAVPDRNGALVTLAAGTGIRQGEALGLTVDRVTFLRRQITVDRQLVTMPDRAPYLAPPKTEASVRVIPLPQVVVDALAAHLVRWPTDGLLFTTEQSYPIRRTTFSARVATRGEGRGTAGHGDVPRASALPRLPTDPSRGVGEDRAGSSGAASASETLDAYSHLWPDSDDRTREAVDVVLR